MEAGRSLKRGSQLALQGLGRLAELADERHRAEYSKTLMEAEKEAGRRYDEEVRNKVGFDAAGSAQRAQQIYAEVGAKYRPQLAERYQEQFDVAWGRHSNGQFRAATDFEFRNLRQANITSETAIMEAARDRIASSMDPEVQGQAAEEMEEAYTRRYRLLNGGRAITPKSLEAFDKDVNDGDGVLTVNGKKLTIVESEEEAGEGKITRSRIKEIRSAMELQAKAYEKGLTDQYDIAHARVMEGLMKEERFEEAQDYMWYLETGEFPCSAKTLSTLKSAMARHEKAQRVHTEAEKCLVDADAAVSDPGAAMYGGPEWELAAVSNASKLTDPKAKRLALSMIDQKRREQNARLMADTASFIKSRLQTTDASGKPVKLPLHQQQKAIESLPDGPLKNLLTKMHAGWVRAEDTRLNNDPAYQMEAAQKLSAITEAVANGQGTIDGRTYVLKDNEDIAAFIMAHGLTGKYRSKAMAIVQDVRNAVKASEVEEHFVKAVGREITGRDRKTWIPLLQSLLEERRGGDPLGNGGRSKWIKENLNELLKLELDRETGWYRMDDTSDLGSHIADNPDAELGSFYFTPEQFNSYLGFVHPRTRAKLGSDEAANREMWQSRGRNTYGKNYHLGAKKPKGN